MKLEKFKGVPINQLQSKLSFQIFHRIYYHFGFFDAQPLISRLETRKIYSSTIQYSSNILVRTIRILLL